MFALYTIFYSLSLFFLFSTVYEYFMKVESFRKLFTWYVLDKTDDPTKAGVEKIIKSSPIIMYLYTNFRVEKI